MKRLNNALMRADQIDHMEGNNDVDWYAPIVADAEAGLGGPIHAFELMRNMIESGAAGVHFEDQPAAFVRIQDREFALEEEAYTAAKHQHEMGAGYFDQVLITVTGGDAATAALTGSTEERQFS